jgi:HK97 family phage portal protein
MAWYDRFLGRKEEEVVEKLNPIQQYFRGVDSSKEPYLEYEAYYENLEVVNRGVNMIVDDVAEIPAQIFGPTKPSGIVKGIKRAKVDLLLNVEPNPFQDISTFKRNLIIDYLIDGNIFIYFDGAHLYHIPASKMRIHEDSKTYISHFEYNEVKYSTNEIIHIKENSFYSIFRGTSRLKPSLRTMQLVKNMRDFQDNFFQNGAVPGLVLKSPNTLSEKIKERMIASWSQRYRPSSGGRRPLILDGGIEVDDLTNVNFKDLDFQNAIKENEKVILSSLGIPPILMDSGNNANIRPNMRMYYLETILPIVRKLNYGLERFFGFQIKEDVTDIPALQPELRDQSSYYSALVNGGIITINEARERLGYDVMDGQDNIREPANIAGSAVNPDEGGRPPEEEEGNDTE